MNKDLNKYIIIAIVVFLSLLFFIIFNPNILEIVSDVEYEKKEFVEARITKYLWTGYTMANGEYPKEGDVAISDRDIPLGTKIAWRGKEYTINDRTAKWVHDKFGTTIDIYTTESKKEALEFGAKIEVVTIFR